MYGNINYMICSKCGIKDMDYNHHVYSCGNICRLNIVLFNEDLPSEKIKDMKNLILKNKPKYIIVIGTSMQFPYLRGFK